MSSYWKDQELTHKKLVEESWGGSNKVLWYKTGDLVNSDQNGDLVFIGRTDDQIQVSGYRVELGEIEHVLRTFAEVDRAVLALVSWQYYCGGKLSNIYKTLNLKGIFHFPFVFKTLPE